METTATYLDPAQRRRLENRLARIEGQVRALRRMIGEGRCADEILIQAAAARGALDQFSRIVLEQHLRDCVRECMEGDRERLADRVARAIEVATKLRV